MFLHKIRFLRNFTFFVKLLKNIFFFFIKTQKKKYFSC